MKTAQVFVAVACATVASSAVCEGQAQGATQAHAAPQATGRFVPVPGLRIWCVDTGGSGEVVVLLHPNTGSSAVWEYQLPALTAAGYRVVAPDRRGWGRTEIDPNAEQPGTGADDLKALLDALGVARVHLVSTAGGGFVAFDFALSFPERLISLVVANSIGGLQDEDFLALGRILRPAAFNALPPELKEVGPTYRAENVEGTRRWVELEHVSRPPGPRAPSQNMKNTLTLAALEKIRVPTLLLTGNADLYAPPPIQRMFAARIAGAQEVVLNGVGHSAYWEAPDAFNAAVIGFLKKR